MSLPHLTVISFVGPSGSGKSTAMKALCTHYEVLQERYIALNRYSLDNRLLLSKWAYIQYWFDGVLEARGREASMLLTDRCPLDTCAYVREKQSELVQVLETSISELKQIGIAVRTVLATAPFDILQARIESRLGSEPERLSYNEASIEHNRRAYDFYSDYKRLWDRTIDTSKVSKAQLPELFEAVATDILHSAL